MSPDHCSPAAFRRPTKADLEAAQDKTIPDVIGNNLRVLFVGINPSLYSAAVGCHFARPGNRFWPALHGSGWTERLYQPWEQQRLLDRGCGITNIVPRATARADELSAEELKAGAKQLARKVGRRKPRCVAFVGITAYRSAYARSKAVIGPQEEQLGAASIYVLPNPSGLNAHYQLPALIDLFTDLRNATDPLSP